jgi:hypothetical protein
MREVNAKSLSVLISDFRQPPRDCSQVPFWFWNGPLEPQEMRRQLRLMADQGVFAAMPHPRFGMDRRQYLEEPFWKAMAATLDEARKLGMQIWMYDEYNWPSGGAGGRVTDGHPELYPRGLDYVQEHVTGPRAFEMGPPGNMEPSMEVFERYLAAFVRRSTDPNAPWQAWGSIQANGGRVSGTMGEGEWTVLAFYQALGRNPSPLDDGSGSMTDYLTDRSLDRFIGLTHEQYRRRFGHYFGTVIPAVFSDESSTTAPAPFPWTADFADQFRQRRGQDLTAILPHLVDADPPAAALSRMAYWQTVTDLYGGRYLRSYGTWCRQHGLQFTGHVYDENLASYAHAPQLFDLLGSMDYPGFDALGPLCPPQGAKTAISAAHLGSRDEALCEDLGLAGGWNCTLDMIRTGTNQLGWLGVSRFVPHAFFQTVENPRVECPPSFFFQNPYWKYYRHIADLSARLSYFNRLGVHVAPIALYYPAESLWADSTGGKGHGVLPWQHRSEGNSQASQTIRVFNDLIDRLCAARWDLDVVDSRRLAGGQVVAGSRDTGLKIGPETFRLVVVPPLTAVGAGVLTRLDLFMAEGGTVLWLGRLPQWSWPAADPEWTDVLKRWCPDGPPGAPSQIRVGKGRVVFLPPEAGEAVQWLLEHARPEVSVPRALSSLRVNHRRLGNLDLVLVYNDSDQGLDGDVPWPTHGACLWIDLDEGTAWKVEPAEHGYPVILRPRQTAVVAYGQPIPDLPARNPGRPAGKAEELSSGWQIQVLGEALDRNWRCSVGETTVALPVFKMRNRAFQRLEGWTRPDYNDLDWTRVAAVRQQATVVEGGPLLLRAVLPPGTRGIVTPLATTGEYAIWLNGTLLEKRLGPAPVRPSMIPLAAPSSPGDVLAIETTSHMGPAGLSQPLTLRCGPAEVDTLRSWSEWEFGFYAGRVLYRRQVDLGARPGKVWLDLGRVQHTAEVWVNGRLAGPLLWPPYEMDISAWCRPGGNEIVLVVANSIANRFAWDIWGSRGSAKAEPSGILGPVRLWRDGRD